MSFDPRPIGMFDSGVGGLSVLKELRQLIPDEDILYFADQGHVPYGPRPLEEIQSFVRGITQFFLSRDVKLIVIPCNAASAAGLKYIRGLYPDIPFVGMEPAIKPAAAQTRNGIIGVITTKATYQGELFASVMERFAKDKNVVTQVCPDFVLLVEAGKVEGSEVRQTAEQYLQPLLDQGIDQLVIGCTHFPFLMSTLQSVLGPDVNIVDPGPAIARQSVRMIENLKNDFEHQGTLSFYTSGDKARFMATANLLLGMNVDDQVSAVTWDEKAATVTNPG
jgi:glutamate racemase